MLDDEVDAAQRADRSGLRVERPSQPTGDEHGAGNCVVLLGARLTPTIDSPRTE